MTLGDPELDALIDGGSVRTSRSSRQASAAKVLNRLTQATRHQDDTLDGNPSFDLTDVFGGVTVGWLSKVFGIDPSDIKKRLSDCPPLHRRKAGYVYSLKQAAGYLVKPVVDMETHLKNMKPSELPTQIQAAYWDAALKRQKWEENAGHLWRSEQVIEVLGETFKVLKSSMQLWADNIERITGLSEDQRKILQQSVDGLQDEIYDNLVEMAKQRSTPSTLAEIEDTSSYNDLI